MPERESNPTTELKYGKSFNPFTDSDITKTLLAVIPEQEPGGQEVVPIITKTVEVSGDFFDVSVFFIYPEDDVFMEGHSHILGSEKEGEEMEKGDLPAYWVTVDYANKKPIPVVLPYSLSRGKKRVTVTASTMGANDIGYMTTARSGEVTRDFALIPGKFEALRQLKITLHKVSDK